MALSLTIDGKTVTAESGENLLDVARRNGAQIASLCHHSHIEPYGACRLCLVEVTKGGRKKLTTSCNYEVLDGIEVRTDTDEIKAHRKMVLELLLGLAPNSKRIQGLARANGIPESRFRKGKSPADRENCILCGLCSRVCTDVVGASAITLTGRGDMKGLNVPFEEQISDACIGCGACAAVCPTDAIDMESIKVAKLKGKPASDRPCRYAMMGLMNGAVCPNNYECAKCEVDQRFLDASYPEHPIFAARGLVQLKGWEE
jgi:predicted molibdopterin-dependent oxidoreductase YjgC